MSEINLDAVTTRGGFIAVYPYAQNTWGNYLPGEGNWDVTCQGL